MQFPIVLIPCPQHPHNSLSRVNPDPQASQHIYCPECLLEYDDGVLMYRKFPILEDFLTSTAASFQKDRASTGGSNTMKNEYFEFLSQKEEKLRELSIHLNNQKNYVNQTSEELKSLIVEQIDQYKNKQLKVIAEELKKLRKLYQNFEDELRIAYPEEHEVNKMLPSFAELLNSLNQIKESPQLEAFLKRLKHDLFQNNFGLRLSLQADETKKEFFDNFIEKINQELTKKPKILLSFNDDIEQVKEATKKKIDKILKELFSLKDSLVYDEYVGQISWSKLATTEHLLMIKEWLPEKYNFITRLLYRASKDGTTPAKFHELCDGKGPTVTIIQCQFEGSSVSTFIGGFLDQSWHSEGKDIESEESFIFSLKGGIKCPLVEKGIAAFGSKFSGPTFCGKNCYEIVVNNSSTKSFFTPGGNYHNSDKLIESENYEGSGKISFKVLDYEVFALN